MPYNLQGRYTVHHSLRSVQKHMASNREEKRMRVTVSFDPQSVRTCAALACFLGCTTVSNGCLFPAMAELAPASREMWTVCSVASVLLVAILAYVRPRALDGRRFFAVSALCCVAGLATTLVGILNSDMTLLFIGSAVTGLGDGWFAAMAGTSLASLGSTRCALVIPGAFLVNVVIGLVVWLVDIPLAVAIVAYGVLNIASYPLVRPYVAGILRMVRASDAPVSLQAANPFSFLSAALPMLVSVLVFGSAYGLVLTLSPESGATVPWQAVPALACVIYACTHPDRRAPIDALFIASSYLFLAGVVLLPLSIGALGWSQDVAGVALQIAYTCFGLMSYYIVAGLSERNPLGAVLFSATVIGISWSGIALGAETGLLIQSLAADSPRAVLTITATIALVVAFYAFVVLRGFSFSERMLGIAAARDVSHIEKSRDEVHDVVSAMAARYNLTPRETEVLALLAQGRSVPVIEEKLHLSKNTVKTHVRHIYEKTGIHSQQEIISLADGC